MNNPPETSLQSEKALKRLRRRRAADTRFRMYGLAALGFALFSLVFLISAIAWKASGAVTYHVVKTDIVLTPERIAPDGNASPEEITRNIEGFYTLVRDDLFAHFPNAGDSLAVRQDFSALVDRLAVLPLARRVARHPSLIGQSVTVEVPVSDDVDLFLKRSSPRSIPFRIGAGAQINPGQGGGMVLAQPDLRSVRTTLTALGEQDGVPSVFVTSKGAVARLSDLGDEAATFQLLAGDVADFESTPLKGLIVTVPESRRTISDLQIAWALALRSEGIIRRVPHTSLLTRTDSTYPELAGALAALVGSLLTMLVTGMVAIPMGIFAAIFLEEFAPKNRLTQLIEVNINNLAAVPSIVFGLLGATLLLGTFGLPRSAPLVGGLVLALLILPVVIIAARAALRAVPPSIRSGALAVGASRMQAVFHHVLPLAFPGMLTGAILGMARALGETAPLLLIGMVAFVAEVPSSTTDEATALPVLIYSWASNAERAWEPMTAAVIVILLALLVIMNVIVVMLRRKFERRW
ncbi:phosphate ABC transporter permease PstA [Hyphomonas sp.]|jgi:phosphate transport system permease protein|uniref:phosphate ABC transporter permease PstA n=1 Tax=Hyphomonas sp. TaxID=87 RepID=UPI0032D8D9F0